jgi:hypothetical protein
MLSVSQLLMASFTAPRARPQRNKNSGLQEILAAERLDEWGKVDKRHRLPGQPKQRLKRNTKRIKVMDDLPDNDPDNDDDGEYRTEVDEDSSSDASQATSAEDGISNTEVSRASSVIPVI